MKAFMKKNWNYLLILAIPWILFLIHVIAVKVWYGGDICILADDAGSLYYPLYCELWDKVHHGGSLLFTWNAGLGTDFLIYIFRCLLSPATLIILLLPKAWISGAMQFFMIVRWSLLSFTMLYYIMHTKYNKIEQHRKLTGILLTSAFCFGNAVIDNIFEMGSFDALILFPVLMLLTEQLQEKKKRLAFVLCLTMCIISHVSVSIPISIFLMIWYLIHSKKTSGRQLISFLMCMLLSYMMAMVVVLPGIAIPFGHPQLYPWENLREAVTTGLVSVTDFIHRLFLLDSTGIRQEGQPVLYCSVTLLLLAMIYILKKEKMGDKWGVIFLTLLLLLGLVNGGANLFWHGFIGMDRERSGFSFLLVFMILYMAMCVLGELENLKKYHLLIVGIFGVACIVYAFFTVDILLDFYVYLGTLLIFILMVLLLFFYCKKSIQHRNIYVVLAVATFLELFINANVCFLRYETIPMEDTCYRRQDAVLSERMDLSPGERVAVVQDVADYNMIGSLPSASGELAYTNSEQQELYKRLGLGFHEDAYSFSGASPLLNLMFHVRYGISAGTQAFSDITDCGENDGVGLYSMDRLAGSGYMAADFIKEWTTDSGSPFQVQNDFVKKAAGTDDIFTILYPADVRCDSVMGKDPQNRTANMGAATHGMEKKYGGMYDDQTGYFTYQFVNGYYGENVMMKFVSDGVTDYYIHVKCGCSLINHVVIDEETVFSDALPARERTYHIGVVEKGKVIQINSNAEVDNDDMSVWQLQYQFAGFSEETYEKAYEELSSQVYEIDEWKDTYVSGLIDVQKQGMMVTSIPALPGFKVTVDGKQMGYERIGNALIGISLKPGKHKITFSYRTPFLTTGAILSVLGLILTLLMFVKPRYREKKTGGESRGEA